MAQVHVSHVVKNYKHTASDGARFTFELKVETDPLLSLQNIVYILHDEYYNDNQRFEVEKPPYTLQKKARNEFDVSVILHHVNHQQIKLNYRIGSKARKENFSINFPINTKSLVVEIPNRLNLSCVDSPLKYRAVLLDDACYSGLDESSDIEGLDDPNGEDECHTEIIIQDDICEDFEDEAVTPRAAKGISVKWLRENFNEKPPYEDRTYSSESIEKPVDYFFKYLPHDLWAKALVETNLFISKEVEAKKRKNPDHITYEQLMKYVALNIASGVYILPRTRMYWEDATGMKLFKDNLSRDDFLKIRNTLHFTNKSSTTDRLFKVRPLYEAIRARCRTHPVDTNVSIDERVIPFKGRINIKQYMRNKPYPWGVKMFILANQMGQVYDFLIYQGTKTEYDPKYKKTYGITAATVMFFVKSRNLQKCNLYCDNWFLSYDLMEHLTEMGVNCAGTIRTDRFKKPCLPTPAEQKDFKRGDTFSIRNQQNTLGIIQWFDSKPVTMVSNFILGGTFSTVERLDKKNKDWIKIPCPEIIQLYNKYMGGVDSFNQLMKYYRISSRTRKWTVKMINHAIDMAVTLSYIDYKREKLEDGFNQNHIMQLMQFRLEAVNGILEKVQENRPATRSQCSNLKDNKRIKLAATKMYNEMKIMSPASKLKRKREQMKEARKQRTKNATAQVF